jgi:hypothetical protein
MSGFITSWAIDRPTSPRPARSEAVREGFASGACGASILERRAQGQPCPACGGWPVLASDTYCGRCCAPLAQYRNSYEAAR